MPKLDRTTPPKRNWRWKSPPGGVVYVRYKGRDYRLLFIGDTKYGERAHLEGHGHDFWVEAQPIVESMRKNREYWEGIWTEEYERRGRECVGWRPGMPRMYRDIIGD